MSYGVEFTAEAEGNLLRLPPEMASFVMDRIDELAGAPGALSRPAGFPYPPGQMYQFWGTGQAANWHFTVLFKYSQDEMSLVILAIGVVRY